METLPAQSLGRETHRPRSRVAGFFILMASVLMILAGCAGTQTSSTPSGLATRLSTASAVVTPQFDPGVGAPLPNNRIVTAYGIAGGEVVNGPASSLDMLDNFLPQLHSLGQQYAALDPVHPVKLGIDLVVNVFDLCQTPRYCSAWASDDLIQAYIDYCQKHDLLLFFDVQLGTEPVADAVTNHLLSYLRGYSFTELALDTEFHFPDTPDGHRGAAAYARGQMHASEINWAIDQLAQIPSQKHLPRKVLLVHEFDPYILPDKSDIKRNPNVSLVLQTDGFGGYESKVSGYEELVQQELLEYGGYKIFFHYPDSGSFDFANFSNPAPQSPQEVLQLFPQPLFISYQ